VLVGSLVLSRFDLWPALLLAVALFALLEDRHAVGWAFLGAAATAKLWPLVVCPPALAWSAARGRARAVWAGLAVVAAVVLPFFVLAPHGLWSSLHRQAARPLQVESLAASVLAVFGHPAVVTSYGSQNVAGHGATAAVAVAAQILVLVLVWVEFALGPPTRDRFVRSVAAGVVAFVAFGKVLSPQFLLWLIPLVPLVRGRRGTAAVALLTIACVLTQVWFPTRYFDYADTFRLSGVVLARNLVLVALFAVLAWPSERPTVARRSSGGG
jgi:uncharacterized membrane protein